MSQGVLISGCPVKRSFTVFPFLMHGQMKRLEECFLLVVVTLSVVHDPLPL